ncbi:MAG: kelch repeat-containing protein [Phycisphaerales bacterium]
MVYDAARSEVVLFGGNESSLNAETWTWDGPPWMLRATTGPSARNYHAMAYDAARGEVVLFGGNPRNGETWGWDGQSWALRATSGPSPRSWHAMVYDAAWRGRALRRLHPLAK